VPKGSIKLRDFMRVLRRLGFEEVRTGAHVIMRHSGTGLLVSVPKSRKEVPPVIAQGIMRQVENYSIVSREEFAEMLKS
jgi:predicted RNA binding protein YcfA (HicA-like mRNA interferase family)